MILFNLIFDYRINSTYLNYRHLNSNWFIMIVFNRIFCDTNWQNHLKDFFCLILLFIHLKLNRIFCDTIWQNHLKDFFCLILHFIHLNYYINQINMFKIFLIFSLSLNLVIYNFLFFNFCEMYFYQFINHFIILSIQSYYFVFCFSYFKYIFTILQM